jgi:hypothetical protein
MRRKRVARNSLNNKVYMGCCEGKRTGEAQIELLTQGGNIQVMLLSP